MPIFIGISRNLVESKILFNYQIYADNCENCEIWVRFGLCTSSIVRWKSGLTRSGRSNLDVGSFGSSINFASPKSASFRTKSPFVFKMKFSSLAARRSHSVTAWVKFKKSDWTYKCRHASCGDQSSKFIELSNCFSFVDGHGFEQVNRLFVIQRLQCDERKSTRFKKSTCTDFIKKKTWLTSDRTSVARRWTRKSKDATFAV